MACRCAKAKALPSSDFTRTWATPTPQRPLHPPRTSPPRTDDVREHRFRCVRRFDEPPSPLLRRQQSSLCSTHRKQQPHRLGAVWHAPASAEQCVDGRSIPARPHSHLDDQLGPGATAERERHGLFAHHPRLQSRRTCCQQAGHEQAVIHLFHQFTRFALWLGARGRHPQRQPVTRCDLRQQPSSGVHSRQPLPRRRQ